jgi:hypothetical protein
VYVWRAAAEEASDPVADTDPVVDPVLDPVADTDPDPVAAFVDVVPVVGLPVSPVVTFEFLASMKSK